jgi:hypothetical protein
MDVNQKITNLRLALWIIGVLVMVCNAHMVIRELQAWHGVSVVRPASAATPITAQNLRCSGPDDMGFTHCVGAGP